MFTPAGVEIYIKLYMNERKQEAEQLAAQWSLVQSVRDQRVGQPDPRTAALKMWFGRLLAALRKSRPKSQPGDPNIIDVISNQMI